MIEVVQATENVVTVKVTGDQEEFLESLQLLKTIPPEDRTYADKTWTIRNPHKYTFIKSIRLALSDLQKQFRLPI